MQERVWPEGGEIVARGRWADGCRFLIEFDWTALGHWTDTDMILLPQYSVQWLGMSSIDFEPFETLAEAVKWIHEVDLVKSWGV